MLQNLIAYINELSGGNQFIGGVLLGAISGLLELKAVMSKYRL